MSRKHKTANSGGCRDPTPKEIEPVPREPTTFKEDFNA